MLHFEVEEEQRQQETNLKQNLYTTIIPEFDYSYYLPEDYYSKQWRNQLDRNEHDPPEY